MADHEWAGSAKIRDVLTGLFGGLDLPGFEKGLDTVIGPLSGGERRRIALAKLLIEDQDLIVLATHGRLDIERTLAGLLAALVADQLPVPILVLPPAWLRSRRARSPLNTAWAG